MAKLVDIDEVIKIIPPSRLSKKTLAELEKLEGKPAISYSDGWCFNEDSRYASEQHELACCMLMAFRYAVDRHGTQALYRMDLHKIIEDNFGMMCDDFIRQMIRDIQREFRFATIGGEVSYPVARTGFMMKELMEAIDYLLENGKISECQKLTDIIKKIEEVGRDIQWLENKLREPIEKAVWDRDPSYMQPFLDKLQEEYVRRGYDRLEDD